MVVQIDITIGHDGWCVTYIYGDDVESIKVTGDHAILLIAQIVMTNSWKVVRGVTITIICGMLAQ